MGEHAVSGIEKWLLDKTGKDIYFWNFIVLMFFTLFEVGAVFFEKIPGTEIEITRKIKRKFLSQTVLLKTTQSLMRQLVKFLMKQPLQKLKQRRKLRRQRKMFNN